MGKQYITDSTTTANTVYYGQADFGRAETSKFWGIYTEVTVGGIKKTFRPIGSDGMPSDKEEFGWDEKASLNYSATDDVTAPTLSTVTLADISGSIAEGITITYVAGGNGTVADLAGNVLATDAVGVLIPTWA